MQYSGLLTLQVCALANGKCTLVLEMTNFVKCWSSYSPAFLKDGVKLFYMGASYSFFLKDLPSLNMPCLLLILFMLICFAWMTWSITLYLFWFYQTSNSHLYLKVPCFWEFSHPIASVSYTHLTLPTNTVTCRSRWSPYH